MLQLHVVLDQPKNWLEYAPQCVTAFAAAITVFVAIFIARNQGRLQKALAEMQLEQQARQLKWNLFDRRFAVFAGVLEFISYVVQKNGVIELAGPGQYREFRECMETAEMLFGNDVIKYLEDVDETAREFYVSARRRGINSGDIDAINRDGELLSRLSVTLLQQRKGVFRPYLFLPW
jgi:hypothetical protein